MSMDNQLQVALRQAGYEGDFELGSLVRGCADKFFSLAQIQKGEWQAVGPWNKDETDRLIVNFNATPEEAVAKLYLALHVKDKPNV